MAAERVILPIAHQPALPAERFLVREAPGSRESDGVGLVPMDVVFIGAGPAGLCGAIELARRCKSDPALENTQIAVLEKSASLGGHSLSGAVINPIVLRELFPNASDDELPFRGAVDRERVLWLTPSRALRVLTPPTMRNHGNRTASLCEVVRWLGARAEELGVTILPGYPADALLVDDAGRALGVRTTPTGLARDGAPGSAFSPPTDIRASFTVLCEGTRGPLAQACLARHGVRSANPQIFALGVKELWEVKTPPREVIHTMGWPLPPDAFGGSFLYPMGDNLLAIGIVVGLDSSDPALDAHELLQRLKTHPSVRPILEGGACVEWGAKTIPEGGFWAIPERLGGPGFLVCGDSAGFVEVASLKGVHYAMHSGVLAARAMFSALQRRASGADVSDVSAEYRAMIDASSIRRDLYERRNLRLAFKSGRYVGAAKAGLMTLSRGRLLGGRIGTLEDAAIERRARPASNAPFAPDGRLTFGKLEGVGRADNATRDDIPSHLLVGKDVPADIAAMYASLCPAGVYEVKDGRLIVNAPNCVDCKATDVLGPRWTPREGGAGPNYKRM